MGVLGGSDFLEKHHEKEGEEKRKYVVKKFLLNKNNFRKKMGI